MNKNLKKILFLNKSWPIRIWMWSAIAGILYYLIKFNFRIDLSSTELDMIIMAYGLGSLAIYVLIYGFDWS